MIYKKFNFYHLKMNEKIKKLNDILKNIISKLLLRKSIKLWNLYLNQALFIYRIHINQIIKISSFYLILNNNLIFSRIYIKHFQLSFKCDLLS